MSTFEVPIVKIRDVEPIKDADRIELAVVGDFRSVVQKGSFQPGDLAVYIPEQSLVPEWLLQKLNLWDDKKGVGKLAGKHGNRVKPTLLKGHLSQGILYPVDSDGDYVKVIGRDGHCLNFPIEEAQGQDVSEFLEIEKWEPDIPVDMAGDILNLSGKTLKFDIENIKKYPDVFVEGEEVAVTEKIHGTFCALGIWPELNHPELTENEMFCYSKGIGEKGLAFKHNTKNSSNIYLKKLKEMKDFLRQAKNEFTNDPLYILGEIYGDGIQDLKYGAEKNQRLFRMFDVFVGHPKTGRFLNYDELVNFANFLGIEMVPEIYRGPYNKDKMDELCKGKTSLADHVREGIVIKPTTERRDPELGRVTLKHVNEDYLIRGKGTEYK